MGVQPTRALFGSPVGARWVRAGPGATRGRLALGGACAQSHRALLRPAFIFHFKSLFRQHTREALCSLRTAPFLKRSLSPSRCRAPQSAEDTEPLVNDRLGGLPQEGALALSINARWPFSCASALVSPTPLRRATPEGWVAKQPCAFRMPSECSSLLLCTRVHPCGCRRGEPDAAGVQGGRQPGAMGARPGAARVHPALRSSAHLSPNCLCSASLSLSLKH